MKITDHFAWEEMAFSQTAIRLGMDNIPDELKKQNIKWLCVKILEPIRVKQGPVIVTSGYRCPELNKAIGGSATSQHCQGQAADIVVPGMKIEELFLWITEKTNLPYDQCIQEFGSWVHISYTRERQRKQALRAIRNKGKVEYLTV